MYIYTRVQRVFQGLYNDKNAQTAQKAPERHTGRGNDQISIYTTEGIIRVYKAFWRLGKNKIKYHIL